MKGKIRRWWKNFKNKHIVSPVPESWNTSEQDCFMCNECRDGACRECQLLRARSISTRGNL